MGEAADNPTRPVRTGEELDWAALDRHLREALPWLRGEPEVSQFEAGKSNLTYRLRYANDDLVVRRPPFGTKARSAHSMSREFEVMSRLRPRYTAVPETLYYTDDESVIGAEFYVMRKVEGQLVKRALPPEWRLGRGDTARLCAAFWSKLVELHQVDYRAAGLADFGRPEGYVGRQIEGWNRRYERVITPDVERFADVRDWLEAHLPPASGRYAVLHGDFRIDNVLLDREDPCRIVAVLDWEISALGEPLMDLGNALAYWIEADDPPALRGLAMQPSDAPGMMSRAEVIDFYCQRTGIEVPDFTFYAVYGYWRNAVILQQIYYRYFRGETRDRRFAPFAQLVVQLGNHCRQLIEGRAG